MPSHREHIWRQPVRGPATAAGAGPTSAPQPTTPSRTRAVLPPMVNTMPADLWLDNDPFVGQLLGSPTNVPFCVPDGLALETITPDDAFTFQAPGKEHVDWVAPDFEFPKKSRPWSIVSSASSIGSSFSPVQTEVSDTATIRTLHSSRDPSPHDLPPAALSTLSSVPCWTADSRVEKKYTCDWAGCGHGQKRSFATHAGLVWHVKAEHLLVCPASGCVEGAFGSARMVTAHIAVAHPETGAEVVKQWQLEPSAPPEDERPAEHIPTTSATVQPQQPQRVTRVIEDGGSESTAYRKRKYQEQLQSVVERRAKRARKSSDSQSSDRQVSQPPSFALVWEHAVLPFLIDSVPKWSTPRHVISTTRGRTPDTRRINIMTQVEMSRARKVTVASHVLDLLPEAFRHKVSFVFSVGNVVRTVAWARGLSSNLQDDICSPRNPYLFHNPCMGDSIGIKGNGSVQDSTATLGPCISVNGASFWLGNFHPFLEAYQTGHSVKIEHPSPQDRSNCIASAHDSMPARHDYGIGDLRVTSGLNLHTTRVSHDPYWEDMGKENPLVVTDWALIASSTFHANILRRFPSDTQAPVKEPLIRSTSAIVPGATVVSSGRTSGYQRGQVCEIPAYVSGEENGTQKATREWFIEEPYPCDNEEAWIRGGIGVEGDSGAAVVDPDTNALVGQVWGRNRYWGPGPRHTFFTPMSDIFDDIQEKCGQQTRPQLPQHRDEADRYLVYPSCGRCYDLQTYLDSRRSSRVSLQSMIMGRGDCDQDITSTEAASELDTPRGAVYIEEMGASFNNILSPAQFPSVGVATPATPCIADLRSPYAYAQTLELDDVREVEPTPGPAKKRPNTQASTPHPRSERSTKRARMDF